MKSDIDEMLQSGKTSFVHMVGEEAERKKIPETKTRNINVRVIIFGLLGIIILGSAGYFFFFREPLAELTPQTVTPQAALFATESSRTINAKTDNQSLFLALMEDASREREREGTIKRIIIKLQDGPNERFSSPEDFFEAYRIVTPDRFLDLLDPALMTFFFYGSDGSRFGMAVNTRDPDRTFALMLSWEPRLLNDFRPLLFGETPENIFGNFEDRTYRNIDWRYLKLSQQKDLGIGYTIFRAEKIFMLATSKEAMERSIDRLFEMR